MEVSLLCVYLFILYLAYRYFDSRGRDEQLDELENRYILVTGCDTGFGHSFAKRLDLLGCNVFAGCLTEKGEEELKKKCSQRLVTFHLDVADHDSVLKAYDFVKGKLPDGKGLWGVHNNAGIAAHNTPIEWLKLSDYQHHFNINTLGLIDVTTTFLPLIKKEEGRVVNTASMAGRISSEMLAPYCMSKYAVEAFSDSLRRQMRIFKVSVHIIEPGFFKTNITNPNIIEKMYHKAFNDSPNDVKEEYGQQYVEEVVEKFVKGKIEPALNDNIELVVDAYEHAMLARYPRARYVVGTDANYLWLPLTWIPTSLADFIAEYILGYGKPVPRVCQGKL